MPVIRFCRECRIIVSYGKREARVDDVSVASSDTMKFWKSSHITPNRASEPALRAARLKHGIPLGPAMQTIGFSLGCPPAPVDRDADEGPRPKIAGLSRDRHG
jgi:hypothetical protein